MTIAHEVALRWRAIAERRQQGDTWPHIAAALLESGVAVPHEHLRVYWNRTWGSKTPEAVLSEMRAATAEAAVADLTKKVEHLEERIRRDAAEIARLRAENEKLRNFDV